MSRGRSGVRLVDVAERAGVSLATASRSLSDTAGVSRQVADHVREIARSMGYVTNLHARTLAGGRTTTAGLLVHDIADPYFAEIARGVVDLARENGWMVQICHTGRDPHQELDQIRILRAHRVGAIIVAGSGYVEASRQAEIDAELSWYAESGGRVAVVGRHHLHADAVLPDNEPAGRTLADHLLDLGHRRIAVAVGQMQLTTVADRLAGVASALQDRGLSLSDLPLVETDFTREGGHAAAERILVEHPDATAILALNDAMAIGVMSTLRARGVRVPDDVSVVGFDDVDVAADLAPSLTTVRLPMTDMGRQAFSMTLRQPASRPRRQRTRHELKVRDSSASPTR